MNGWAVNGQNDRAGRAITSKKNERTDNKSVLSQFGVRKERGEKKKIK